MNVVSSCVFAEQTLGDSLDFNRLVLQENPIIKTNVASRDASDFAADKDVKFNGVGLMSHLVCYDSTLIDHPFERQTSATALFSPSEERLESENVVRLSQKLSSVTLCNYDLSKVSEESKGNACRNVQTHHLDKFKNISSNLKTSTGNSTMTMKSLKCHLGVASAWSSPDGVGSDDRFVRYVWEVKPNIITPAVALRQAVSEGTNVGWAQLRSGVKWSDVYVPLIGGNGYLIQFAVLVFLKPGFPYSFMLSKVLDLTDQRDRLVAAGHLSMIFAYNDEQLQATGHTLAEDEFAETQMGLFENLYHLKREKEFFCCKRDVDDSLLHLFSVMSAVFTDEICRQNVLFPLCIRQATKAFDLVFLKLTKYKIGLPASLPLRKKLLASVKEVLVRIHNCGVAHLDLYPSNIMWKEEDDGAVHVMIIDWDSAHFVHEVLHSDVSERLSSHGRADLAGEYALAERRAVTLFDYDLSLLRVLEKNMHNPSLQESQKSKLDSAFFLMVQASKKA